MLRFVPSKREKRKGKTKNKNRRKDHWKRIQRQILCFRNLKRCIEEWKLKWEHEGKKEEDKKKPTYDLPSDTIRIYILITFQSFLWSK